MTGASCALGRALLRRLWADPAWVGVLFLLVGRDREALRRQCLNAEAAGREAEPWVLDLTDPDAGGACLEVLKDHPPLRGLVFAAGAIKDRPLALLEEADFDRVWAVNTGGHARVLEGLRAPGALAPDARGLLVGSLSGRRGNAGQTAYAAAKGALADLLPAAPSGLRLNLLLPPLMPSPLLEPLDPAARERLFRNRLMDDPDPADACAQAAAFLLSDRASYIHRQVVHADSRVTALGWD